MENNLVVQSSDLEKRPVPDAVSPAVAYLASRSPASRPKYAYSLRLLSEAAGHTAASMPWASITPAVSGAIRARLGESGLSPATLNRCLVALRGVVRTLWKLGTIDADTRDRICDLEPIRGSRLPAGRELSQAELGKLMAACDADGVRSRGYRDAAMLALLYGGALRRAEAAALTVAAVVQTEGAEELRLRLVGKGNKERFVPLPLWASRRVAAWLDCREGLTLESPLLAAVRKGGAVLEHGISASSIWLELRRISARAGVADFTPHDLRRTYASNVLDEGGDIVALAAVMGHASTQTTGRYDRRGERAARKVASLVRDPSAP